MEQSEKTAEIFAALSKAQGAIETASKDSINPHYDSKYADLASVREAIRKPLSDNGLSFTQEATAYESSIGITTQLNHSSGEWLRFGPTPIPMGKPNAHQVGSAITYGRRYALCAALGVVADVDDDGNAAADAKPVEARKPTSKPASTPPESKLGSVGEEVKALMRSKCKCKSQAEAMHLIDAVSCGQYTLRELENEAKAKVVLGLFENANDSIPFAEMLKRIDEVRRIGLDKEVTEALTL